jgi:hypothetical protein
MMKPSEGSSPLRKKTVTSLLQRPGLAAIVGSEPPTFTPLSTTGDPMTKTYRVVLQAKDDDAAIRLLRQALKTLLRSYGMRAIEVVDVST